MTGARNSVLFGLTDGSAIVTVKRAVKRNAVDRSIQVQTVDSSDGARDTDNPWPTALRHSPVNAQGALRMGQVNDGWSHRARRNYRLEARCSICSLNTHSAAIRVEKQMSWDDASTRGSWSTHFLHKNSDEGALAT
jgi:hypothetical protein